MDTPNVAQSRPLCRNRIGNKISQWQQRADHHTENQLINPFSSWDGAQHRQVLDKNDPRYGRPVEGSKTEYRGKQAGVLISSEIVELCRHIADLGMFLFFRWGGRGGETQTKVGVYIVGVQL